MIWLRKIFQRSGITLAANELTLTDTSIFFNEQYNSEPTGPDNWVLLSPYGDFPNSKGMQRFDKVAANAVIEHYNGLGNSAVRIMGLPWYKGHPDIPEFRERYRDTDSYGRIKGLKADDAGLWANVRWNDDGKRLITEQKYHGHSVAWYMRPIAGGVYQPFALRSVGFTNEPNIPVPPILSANETMNAEQQKQLAKALGLPEAATFEQVLETATKNHVFANETSNCPMELAAARKKLTDLEAAHKTVQDKVAANEKEMKDLADLRTANATLTANVATLTKERDDARVLASNERAERAKPAIAQAVKEGRITVAQEKDYATIFANEGYDKGVAKLAALKPSTAMHTTSMLDSTGRRADNAIGNKTAAICLAVNECMEKNPVLNYNDAFNKVRAEQPALFTN